MGDAVPCGSRVGSLIPWKIENISKVASTVIPSGSNSSVWVASNEFSQGEYHVWEPCHPFHPNQMGINWAFLETSWHNPNWYYFSVSPIGSLEEGPSITGPIAWYSEI